jgi:lipoprotein-anchoring transpeptidase ErfK/SrfK
MRYAPFFVALLLAALGGSPASESAPEHVLVLASAVAPPSPPAAAVAVVPPAPPPTPPEAPPAQPAWIDEAVADLRAAMAREVPDLLAAHPEDEPDWNRRVAGELEVTGHIIDRPQLLVTVDRNPAVQQLRIVLARQGAPWLLIGAARISTGEPGLTGHYKTPVGVFEHTSRIIDYRAEGTYSRRRHVRGLGVRGMRVWDFGWQETENWREPNGWMRIRLEIHATDPDTLEHLIGQPISKGCVHVSAALNRFLDWHGILDADYERVAETDGRYRELLLAGRTPTPLAGTMMVVFDSSRPSVPDASGRLAGLI